MAIGGLLNGLAGTVLGAAGGVKANALFSGHSAVDLAEGALDGVGGLTLLGVAKTAVTTLVPGSAGIVDPAVAAVGGVKANALTVADIGLDAVDGALGTVGSLTLFGVAGGAVANIGAIADGLAGGVLDGGLLGGDLLGGLLGGDLLGGLI